MKNFLNKFDLFFTSFIAFFGFIYFVDLVAGGSGGFVHLIDNWWLRYSLAILVVLGYYLAFYDLMKRRFKESNSSSIDVFIVDLSKEEDAKDENKQNE